MALNDNEYNDYQVMVSVYDNTLHVWAEAEIERLTEHRDELQDCNAKLQARVEALEGAIQKNPCLVLVAQGVPYHDCFPLEPCDPCHCGKDLLAATEQGESNHTMTEHTEFCEAWRGRVCTCAATEQGEGDE